MAFVREKLAEPSPRRIAPAKASSGPATVVIIGAGAAGLAAADMLRREGYQGAVTMLSAEDSPPCDRPNLSKDFLAGTAPEDWMPLRVPEFYTERRIELVLNTQVSILDVAHRQVQLGDGRRIGFGAALIATGAEPVRLEIPGAAPSQIHYLRTFADSRAIVAKAATASSGSKWPHLCVRVGSKCTSSDPTACPWNGCWAPRLAGSSKGCTSHTAFAFTWAEPYNGSTASASR
jgi:hypothetical protein